MYPPPSVGPMTGKEPPSRLPWVGTRVVDVDGLEGEVAHYQYYRDDQVWFPVNFGTATRQRRLGEEADHRGYVRRRRASDPAVSRAAS